MRFPLFYAGVAIVAAVILVRCSLEGAHPEAGETMDIVAGIAAVVSTIIQKTIFVVVHQILRYCRNSMARRRLRRLVPLVDLFIYEFPSLELEDVNRLRNELDKLDIPHPYLHQFDLSYLEFRMFYAYLRIAANEGNLDKARVACREAEYLDKENDDWRRWMWLKEHSKP